MDNLSIRECVALIADGRLTAVQMVESCFACIEATEPTLAAWQYLDKENALQQAVALDDMRRHGQPLGALHGIPIGLKDIFDTDDMPTEYGSPIYQANQPAANATVVDKLKEAGAIILGKTVSTEFAYMHPSKTRNPHNPDYSPGGSSSGSAAAVAAGHVPLALGSQTNGSVVRPASFCGVYGYKPSRGIISRHGVLQTSQHLDHVGVFARDIGDLALLSDCIAGYDKNDPASYLKPRPGMLEGYLSEVPVEPNFIWFDLPWADRYSTDAVEAFDELLSAMDGRLERIAAPQSFAALPACHKVIYDYEIYRCLEQERENHWDKLSDTAKAAMESASHRDASAYEEALEIQQASMDWFSEFFNDYDAIVTPSAIGEPPKFGNGTGDPICCTVWTLCGLPTLTMPLLSGANNLPIGVQLVGAYNEDNRLLRSARWLLQHLRDDEPMQNTDA